MNIPKLRFKDNNGNDYPQWKKQILGNISDITKLAGFEFTEYVTYQDSGNIIALRGLNVKNNTLDLSDVKYIDNSDFSKLSRSKLYINDLLFTYVGTIGEVALINQNDKYYLAPNVCRIRHYDNVNAIYLLYIFNSNIIKREIYKYLTKSSQPALSMENIRKFKVSLPYLEEQNKIANFLSTVDKKITNLENIITSLENQKKGLLQQIFSQKLRFKDKNGNNYPNWEKKKLNEISDVSSGKRIPKGMQFPSIGKTFYITVSDMGENFVSPLNINTISDDIENIIKKYKVFTGDIIISVAGTLGKINLITPLFNNANLTENCDRISNFKKVYNLYIFYFLKSNIIQETIKKSSTLSSQPKLALERIRNFNILLPCLEEQTKIADFFSAFDRKLENQKAQLEHWKQIKKGLLQQMFV